MAERLGDDRNGGHLTISFKHARAKELFYRATRLPKAERAEFLEHACGEDDALHTELTDLLRYHADKDNGQAGALRAIDKP